MLHLPSVLLHIHLFSFLILDHIIKDIDSKSPAAKAGLKDNDILVAVNGERVDALDHDSVVGKIRQSETKPTLLVVDKETDAMYKLVRKCKLLLKIHNSSLKRDRSSNKTTSLLWQRLLHLEANV